MPLSRLDSRTGSSSARESTLRHRPQVEALEARDVPSAVTDAILAGTYQALLNRAPDPTAQASFGVALDQGQLSTGELVDAIQTSPEYRVLQVQNAYQQILGRQAETSAVAFWLGSDIPSDQIRAFLLGSDEFYNNAGGTPTAFLNQVYQTALGRAPDPSAVTHFAGVNANSIEDRNELGKLIINSTEAHTNEVNNLYLNVLGRPADAAGLNSFLLAIREISEDNDDGDGGFDEGGNGILQIPKQFITSPEFAGAAQNANFTPDATINSNSQGGSRGSGGTVDAACQGDYFDDLQGTVQGTPNRTFVTVNASSGRVELRPGAGGSTQGLLTGTGTWSSLQQTFTTQQQSGTVNSFFALVDGTFTGPQGTPLNRVLIQFDCPIDPTGTGPVAAGRITFFQPDGSLIDNTVIRIDLVRMANTRSSL